ncbi:ATP-binding cassette domain-containing protein, partial [Nocardia wallacei]|uniref:ATP-binding cassette domain-containing protein n=1 Tax=Nocardia wallacei TaxID=480035 RepID=UPI002453DC2C
MHRAAQVFARQHEMPEPPAAGTVTLRARQVSVDRGAGGRVLDHVDIDVMAGQILALVGPNGAGKSTLLGALSGELDTATGTVELDGRPIQLWTPVDMARRRAVLPQTHTVGFPFTAREVVAMGRAPPAGPPPPRPPTDHPPPPPRARGRGGGAGGRPAPGVPGCRGSGAGGYRK